jgi:hypothetical protein
MKDEKTLTNGLTKLEDDVLDNVSGGFSVQKNQEGYAVYDKDGNTLAFFSNLQELKSFTSKLVQVVGERCTGLSWYIPS